MHRRCPPIATGVAGVQHVMTAPPQGCRARSDNVAMNALWWSFAAVTVTLLVAVLLVQWVRYRAKLHEMRRQLAWSEASRFAAEAQAHESQTRLHAMAEPQAAEPPAPQFDDDDDRLPAVDLAGPSAWADTLPMSAQLDFKSTEPAKIRD